MNNRFDCGHPTIPYIWRDAFVRGVSDASAQLAWEGSMLQKYSLVVAAVVLLAMSVAAQGQGQSVRVRPVELTQPASEDAADADGTLPPVIVEGERPTASISSSTNPTAVLFPSLAEQIIGDPDGGLRGLAQSIFDNPRAVDIVTQQMLTERSPHDMGAALETAPGVLIQRTGRGQSSPFVRGLTGQQVLIMVDGVRMTNATFRSGPNQYFNTIDPNMVERIEVIRGPGSVLYGGDAIGGVINVVTKKAGSLPHHTLTGGTVQRFSSADLGYTGRVNVEGSVGSAGVFAGGGYGNYNNLDLGGPPDAPAGSTVGRQPATSWRYNSADIKLNYLLSDTAELVLGLQHYVAEDVFRSDRFPANRESLLDPQQRDLYFIRLQGYHDIGLINTYQITGSFHRMKEGRREERPIGTFDAQREFTDDQTGVTGVFGTDLADHGWLTYGFDWYHDEVNASIFNPDGDGDQAQFPNDPYYSRYGVFLQWDVPLTARLLGSGGVRFEHVVGGSSAIGADAEFGDWIGYGGLTYELFPCLHVVGSISEGFRAPNLDDLVATNSNVFNNNTQIPNLALRHENSITYEIGAKINTDTVRAQVFYWHTDLRDHILRQTVAVDTLQTINVQSELHGVEFSGEYLLHDSWSVYGNYWYTFGHNNTGNEPLSKLPPKQGIIGLRRRWGDGAEWFDAYGWLVDNQDRLSPRDLTDTRRIPPGGTPAYATLNFRYGRLITQRQRVSVNLENITDTQYRVHGSGSGGAGINAIVTYELLQ